MIAHISGKLSAFSEESVIVDVNGVGYEIFIPESIQSTLPPLQEPVTLHTYLHIREDAQLLFGFTSNEQKAVFLSLISVSGIGPKVGLRILSQLSIETIIQAILKEDAYTFTQVSGLGKKTAEKIIIDLKDKVSKWPQSQSIGKDSSLHIPNTPIIQDLIAALRSLGYSMDEIKRALSKTEKAQQITSLEEGIKLVLRNL